VTAERPSAVGWEKNAQGKLGPRVSDLAPMMDPTRSVVDYVLMFHLSVYRLIELMIDSTD
jgi:ubiquitin-like modifier-activating enzyme ATG7